MDALILAGLLLTSYLLFYGAWLVFERTLLRRWDKAIRSSVPPIPTKIKYFGGPLDGRIDLIDESRRRSFFITPYVSQDEDKRGEVYGMINGQPLYQPNLAYYREVTPSEYFYVRDISLEEYQRVAVTGLPPSTVEND